MNQRVLCIGTTRVSGLPAGMVCEFVSTLSEGLRRLALTRTDAVVLSLDPIGPGITALLRVNPALRVIVQRPGLTMAEAVEYTKAGAFACLSGSELDRPELARTLAVTQPGAESSPATENTETEAWRERLIGESRSMQKVAQIIRLVATRRSTVLITGETGTGKEVVARAIHMASNRRGQPMVAVNCGAIPASLIEAELFGHTKGAFTGAANARVGRFEQANSGTIFLDEIAELPLDLQSKLLRVLQERELQRLGSSETIKVDVRVIAAANVDLERAVAEKRFREDLYYRLNVVPVRLPAVRERTGDVPLLIQHFLAKLAREEATQVKQISEETLRELSKHPWPGNVRQIEHAVELAVVLSGDRDTLSLDDFPGNTCSAPTTAPATAFDLPVAGIDFDDFIGQIEYSLIKQALDRTAGNKGKAAELLGLKRTTLIAKMKTFPFAHNENERGSLQILTSEPVFPSTTTDDCYSHVA
jgi:DNA-binding NtrC family response regulator